MVRNFSKINVFLSVSLAAVFAENASRNFNFQTHDSQSGRKQLHDESSIPQDLIFLMLAILLPIALVVCVAVFFICQEMPENQEEGVKEYCKQQESLENVDDQKRLPEQSIGLDPSTHSIPVAKARLPKAPRAPNSAPKSFTSILRKAITFSSVLASFEDDGSDRSCATRRSSDCSIRSSSIKSTSSDSTCDDAVQDRSSSSSSEDHPQQFSQIQRKTVTFINPFAGSVNQFDKHYSPASKTYSHITGIMSPDLPAVEEIIKTDSNLENVLESDDPSDHDENRGTSDHQSSRKAILKKAVTCSNVLATFEDKNSRRSSAPLSGRTFSQLAPEPLKKEDSVEKFYRRPSTLMHSVTEPGPWTNEKENVDFRWKSMPNLHEDIPTRPRQKTYPGYRSCHGSVAHLHCLYLDGESVGISLDENIKNFEFDDYGNAYEKEMGVVFVNDDGQKVDENFKPQYGDFCR